MSVIQVASISPRMGLSHPERNLRTLARWSRKAARRGADLAFFPEMFITGYGEEFMYASGFADRKHFLSLAEPVPGPSTDRIFDVARDLDICICAGLLEREGSRRYNTQVLITPERGCIGRFRKVHPGPGEAWFSHPGGDWPVLDLRGVGVGLLICRDKSFPEAARILALEGAELLLAPHSSTQRPGMGFRTWSLKISSVRAMENGCYLIANNNIYDCPMKGERRQAGYTFAVDPFGELIHCDRGPADRPKMSLIAVDTDQVRRRREWEGPGFNLWSRHPQAYRRLTSRRLAAPCLTNIRGAGPDES